MVRLTGIKERRYAAEDESATDLAAIAAQHALNQAGMDVSQIDGIIMATLIPDQPVPSAANALAATSRKHRSWTERTKKENPTCSSHRLVVWSW